VTARLPRTKEPYLAPLPEKETLETPAPAFTPQRPSSFSAPDKSSSQAGPKVPSAADRKKAEKEREQAEKAARLEAKHAAAQAAKDRERQEKETREQVKRDREQAKRDAEAAKRAEQEARKRSANNRTQQSSVDGAAEKLRAAEAAYQAELAKSKQQ
jgi:colicin import membrane protein